jgi:hypothetical protein
MLPVEPMKEAGIRPPQGRREWRPLNEPCLSGDTTMSLKKFDLAKNLGLKVAGRMKASGVPDRFAQGAADALDKRERRARDAALGLVPFACKLPLDLVKRINESGAGHEGGVNGLLAELLTQALDGDKPAEPEAKKPAATKAPAKKAAAKKAPAKKAAKADDAQP